MNRRQFFRAMSTLAVASALPSFDRCADDYIVQVANSTVTDVLDTFYGLGVLENDGTIRDIYLGLSRDDIRTMIRDGRSPLPLL